MPEVPGSSLGKCSSISFSHVPIVIHCAQSSGRYDKWIRDERLRGIGTDRKRVRKEKKRVERKVGGGKGDFFWFVFNPPKKTLPLFFQPHPIKKIPFQTVNK